MFNFLKDKIGEWAKKIAKKTEENSISEKEIQKKVKKELKKEAKTEKKIEKKEKKEEKKLKKQVDKELEEEVELKEIELPTKYDIVSHKIEPDLDKVKEVTSELKQEEQEKKSFFQKIGSPHKITISEKELDIQGEELEMVLIENNVALEVAEKIVKNLKEELADKEILKKEVESEIKETFKDIIRDILISPPDLLNQILSKAGYGNQKTPYVILFCGINGSGKTTTIAKIGNYLQSKKISCIMAAGDTFRAASIEQLKKHGEKLDIKVISHDYGSDPASVGFDAIQYAKKNKIDCVLIDTAGRMHTQKNLLREMEKIVKVCKPDKKLFIGESITGNDAVEQVRSFDEAIGIDGIVLTKADIDEKGGTALSLGYVTKKPIFFLGTGQEYKDIEPFDRERFIEKLGL